MKLRLVLSLLLMTLFLQVVHAQETGNNAGLHPDSLSSTTSYKEATLAYTRSSGAKSRLYNGTVYLGYDRHAQGYPFFLSDSALPGSVYYDGIFYPDVLLSFDLEKDIVIMPDVRKTVDIQLLSEKIRWFTIGQHRFVNLSSQSNTVDAPAPGFYEELYSGKATALAKHEKNLQTAGSKTEDNQSRYRQYDRYYLEVRGRFFAVHSNGSLLDAFDTGKDEIKSYLRKNRIRFNKDPEQALIMAAGYYSQLKKN